MEGSFTTCNGHLYYISADGCEKDLGKVCECRVGPQGAMGCQGPAGPVNVGIVDIKGSPNKLDFIMVDKTISIHGDFAAGKPGKDGQDGNRGADGVRILDIQQYGNELRMSLSDGRSFRFMLPEGRPGPIGERGVSIESLIQQGDRTIFTLTDGRTYDLNLQGRSMKDVTSSDNKLIVSFSDGTRNEVEFPSLIRHSSSVSGLTPNRSWTHVKSMSILPGKHLVSYNVIAELMPQNLMDIHAMTSANVRLQVNQNAVPGSESKCSVYVPVDIVEPAIQTLSSFCLVSVDKPSELRLVSSADSSVIFKNPNIHIVSF